MISVLVPVYNTAEYLEKCLESLRLQSCKSFEVIIVDDGSDDGSEAICGAYAAADSRFSVVRTEHGGVAAARNAALGIARGEYIAFVDSDDTVAPDYLESLFGDLTDSGADISMAKSLKSGCSTIARGRILHRMHVLCIAGFFKWFGHVCQRRNIPGGKHLKRKAFKSGKSNAAVVMDGTAALERLLYQKDIDCSLWGKLYRSELFRGIRFPDGKLYEDFAVNYRIFARAARVSCSNYRAYNYRVRANGIMRRKFTPEKIDLITAADEMLAFIQRYYPTLTSAALSRYIRANFHMLLQIPGKSIYAEYICRIRANILRHRPEVLADEKAAIKTKAALLLTYLGIWV